MLSEIKAIRICRDLWKWLAAHPNITNKSSWPGWNKYDGGYNSFIHLCPLCEYTKRNCSKCPLLPLWGRSSSDFGVKCEANDNSPWNRWRESLDIKSKKSAATKIWKYADKLLKRRKKYGRRRVTKKVSQ